MDTGRCICPQLTEGPNCSRCAANAFGWEVNKGCQVSFKLISNCNVIYINLTNIFNSRSVIVIRMDHSTDFVIAKLVHVFVEMAMLDQNVINVHLATMDILDANLVPAIMLEVNQTIVMKLCAVVMNLDSVNAK